MLLASQRKGRTTMSAQAPAAATLAELDLLILEAEVLGDAHRAWARRRRRSGMDPTQALEQLEAVAEQLARLRRDRDTLLARR
jgi:hypothetical protein